MRAAGAAHDVLPAASNTGNADMELGFDENSVVPANQPDPIGKGNLARAPEGILKKGSGGEEYEGH